MIRNGFGKKKKSFFYDHEQPRTLMSKAAETMSISGKNQAGHLRASNFQVEISEGQKKPDIFIPAESKRDFQASLPFML